MGGTNCRHGYLADTMGTKYPVSVYQKYQVSVIRIPQVPSILRTGKVYGYLAVFEGRDRGFPGFFQGYLGLSRVIYNTVG